MLAKHSSVLRLSSDAQDHYGLDATPGPATLKAWRGKMRRKRLPVGWVEIRKSYVSYHLMAVSHARLRAAMSDGLRARMQGKTCFNFTASDPDLFRELDQITTRALSAFREAGFIAGR